MEQQAPSERLEARSGIKSVASQSIDRRYRCPGNATVDAR